MLEDLRTRGRDKLVRLVRPNRGAPPIEFGNLYAHERMLADRVRVDTYRSAIERCIGPDHVVIDLGTGTGVLAMLAARRCKRVYAIDHSSFIEIARNIAQKNGFSNITFVEANSRSFEAPEPIDVILHEQIGDDLFEEDMVVNLLDLKQRVLRPGGTILPGKFALHLDPVSLHEDHRIPFLWENPLPDLDFSFLRGDPRLDRYIHHAYGYTMTSGWAVESSLSDASPVLEVDLNVIASRDEVPRKVRVKRPVIRAGHMDGWLMSFSVTFDDDGGFDTLPTSRRTHWMNRLYRVPGRFVEVDEVVEVTLDLDDLLQPKSWLKSE